MANLSRLQEREAQIWGLKKELQNERLHRWKAEKELFEIRRDLKCFLDSEARHLVENVKHNIESAEKSGAGSFWLKEALKRADWILSGLDRNIRKLEGER